MTDKKKQTGTGKRQAISRQIRFRIFDRDNFTCQYCGQKAPNVVLHVDHITPVSKGGSNDEANLTTACSACNSGKSDAVLTFHDSQPLVMQAKDPKWIKRREEIITRDGSKCVRCGAVEDVSLMMITQEEAPSLSDMADGEFITTCDECREAIFSMKSTVSFLINDAIRGYRFYDCDALKHIQSYLYTMHIKSPDDEFVKHIFNTVEMLWHSERACDVAREEAIEEFSQGGDE